MEPLFAILPLLLLMAAGGLLATFSFVPPRFWDDLNRVIYWLLLPALIVGELAGAVADLGATLRAWGVFASASLLMVFLGLGVACLIRLPFADWGVFVQATFRGNLAFISIPVMQFALGEQAGAVIPTAILVFAPTMILYNVLSVGLLQVSRHKLNSRALWDAGLAVMRNPLVLASVAGLAWYGLPVGYPVFLERTFSALGSTAAPMALLCIGASLSKFPLRPTLSALVAAVLKVAGLPLVALGLMQVIPLTPVDRFVVLVFSTAPTAAAAFILAKSMGANERLAASSIVWATLLAIPALVFVLNLFPPT